MHGSDIPLHRLTATAGHDRLAGRMDLQHQLLGLGFGVVEVGHEDMCHIGHEVDRVVPHDRDPWCLGQRFIDWALGNGGAASGRQTLPIRIRHKNHSCNVDGSPRRALPASGSAAPIVSVVPHKAANVVEAPKSDVIRGFVRRNVERAGDTERPESLTRLTP
jgi:hypothetical protein